MKGWVKNIINFLCSKFSPHDAIDSVIIYHSYKLYWYSSEQ